ncbi:galactose oxidase-like domain-containing protein [Arthrobacter sp. CDRTa11]|uniref:galactose oxidase-like domain-containing protein n=1 Tax=Arthrobacter sp. CDRTa11 TaxID=2651199 RepID=UPI0022659D3D|nr:galactose oxidase-like domain-containing protein [Arthrobacter sp. CDRTa11]
MATVLVISLFAFAFAVILPPPANAAGLAIDKVVSRHQASPSRSIVSPAFTTSQAGELLIAFVSADGPAVSRGQQFTAVTGGGLTWRLRQRTNVQYGTAEVWQAVATGILTNARITATHPGNYQASMTVATFTGADISSDGAVAGASGPTGAPTAALTTTRDGSWVWGVGNDWSRAAARTVGPGQTMVDEYTSSHGDTFWTQRQTQPTATSPTSVTINDTAPTNDMWNLSLIEVRPASGATDTTPPVLTGVSAGTPGQTGATITWTSDEPSTSQVEYGTTASYGSSTSQESTLTTSHSQALGGLSPGTLYHFRVKSVDAANNAATSPDATFTTTAPAPDTTPPTVNITSPVNGATVSGQVSVAATAADNTGVAGVQFRVDASNLQAEDTVAPYAVTWDTTAATAGTHTITAVARDAAGNTTTSANVAVTVSNGGQDPAVVGSWGPLQPWPQVSIHAALTHTGKVLTFEGDFSQRGEQYLLDPGTGAFEQLPPAPADLFCAGQTALPDGRIMVLGGTSTTGGLGIRDITAFNPLTKSWQPLAPMRYARWYATGTTLSDGKVLVTSGANLNSTDIIRIPELYDTKNNAWSELTSASRNIPYYPFMYQLPDGRVLQAGASEQATSTIALDLATQQWSTIDSRIIDGASIANYAPGKFLKAGSAADSGFTGPSSNTAFTLDMNATTPTWLPTSRMQFPRSFMNLTNLPNGSVLATGGGTDKSSFDNSKAVKAAEIWDPTTGLWRTVSEMAVPRLYHSTALLLPDGRVFMSGGGGDSGVTDQKNYQIYSPPYLFKGPRPAITSVPDTVTYNASVLVETPNAGSIQSVSLIRTGAVTHAFDQNERALSLSFTQTPGGLSVQMPANGNYAPPGHYMLSLVNGEGVPSVASMVRFPAPFEDAEAPTAPTALSAAGSMGQVDLAWGASSDNIGVAKYTIYRSATAGFTPGQANQVGQVAGSATSYRDSGLTAGTYYYQVKAEDAASNLSPPSNEASGEASGDTIPPSAPSGLSATAAAGQISLAWTASSDNVGVVRYNISRNGSALTNVSGTSHVDSSVTAGTEYTYTVNAQDAAGNISVASNTATATATGGPKTVTVDSIVTRHQGTNSSTVSVTGLTTTASNELLLAFISSDGPSTGGTASIRSVAGAGLTWSLRQRTNTQAGTAEIWQAVAPVALTNATVTATQNSGTWQSSMSVVGFLNADTANGAVAGASAATGAPTASLTTTRAGSWVWGVGTDWQSPVARTVGPNQTLVDQFLAPAGDTYWVQRQNTPTAASGTLVTINDTAPTNDMWNLAVIEILATP